MTEENKLTKITPFKPGGLKKGIAANREKYEKTMKDLDPQTVPNRIGLVLDDSGSMGKQGMDDAHTAVNGFLNNCNNLDTSIAVYPMNAASKPLILDYDIIRALVNGIWATGSTPLYGSLQRLIEKEKITRGVVFSDGSPTDSSCLSKEKQSFWGTDDGALARAVVKSYVEKEIPIDTIYIGMSEGSGYEEMKELARLTNGVFIHFKDSSSLAKNLKYLAPKYRALLMSPEIKKRIEAGENV